jgi:hypothetical protein
MRLPLLAALALLTLGAPLAAQAADEPVLIRLSRGSCMGFCPSYSVTIAGDGTVTFDGGKHVASPGRHVDHISPARVHALLRKFYNARFWSLRERYAARITDGPSYTLTLTVGERSKTVVDYLGGGAGMPASVKALEDAVDREAGTSRWVGDGTATPPR